jgi:hypothetical protein
MIDSNKPIWLLTTGEFIELQKSIMAKEEQNVPEELYFSPREALSYLKEKHIKISKSTLYRWRVDHVLEAYKIGGLLSYK